MLFLWNGSEVDHYPPKFEVEKDVEDACEVSLW